MVVEILAIVSLCCVGSRITASAPLSGGRVWADEAAAGSVGAATATSALVRCRSGGEVKGGNLNKAHYLSRLTALGPPICCWVVDV